MKQLNITNDEQAIEFLEMLIAEDRVFHLDDMPEDIVWARPIDPETLDIISGNWNALWHYCFPWDLFDAYPDLWAKWKGDTPRATIQRDPETIYQKDK